MKRKPTRAKPNTASAVRAQTRAIRKLAEQVQALRLDVQSMHYGNGATVAAIDRLRAAIEPAERPPDVPTVALEAQMEAELAKVLAL